MNWIERYITAVIAYLPEKEQTEVAQELRSNIYDMLPEDADEDVIKKTLQQLGAPKDLAAQYQQTPHYLIGPTYYDDYTSLLKKLTPLLAVAGFFLGLLAFFTKESSQEMTAITTGRLLTGAASSISTAITFAFHGLFWITLVFIILERVQPQRTVSSWKLEDLPPQPRKKTIALADVLGELIVTLLFGGGFIYLLLKNQTLLVIKGQNIAIFTETFLQTAAWIMLITLALSISESLVKLYHRRYNKPVLLTILLNNLVTVPLWFWLLTRPAVFLQEFRSKLNFNGQDVIFPTLMIILLFLTAVGIGECAYAIFRYRKEMRQNKTVV